MGPFLTELSQLDSSLRSSTYSVIGGVAGAGLGWAAASSGTFALGAALIISFPVTEALLGIPAILTILMPIGGLPVLGPQFTVLRLAVLVSVVWALRDYATMRLVLRDLLAWVLVCLVLSEFIAAGVSPDAVVSRQWAVMMAFSVGWGFAIALSLRSARDLRRFLLAVVTVGALDAVLTLIQGVLGYGVMPSWFVPTFTSEAALTAHTVAGHTSAAGLFATRGANAVFLCLPLCILFASLVRGQFMRKRYVLPMLGLTMAAVVVTYSRLGLVLMLLVAVMAGWSGLRSGLARAGAWLLSVLLLLAVLREILVSSFGSGLLQRLQGQVVSTDFTIGRLEIWRSALEAYVVRPFFGSGPGTFNLVVQSSVGTEAHNVYVSTLVEGGLVGLIFLGSVLALSAQSYLRALRMSRTWAAPWSTGVLAFVWFWVLLLVNGLAGAGVFTPVPLYVFPIVIPVALNLKYLRMRNAEVGTMLGESGAPAACVPRLPQV